MKQKKTILGIILGLATIILVAFIVLPLINLNPTNDNTNTTENNDGTAQSNAKLSCFNLIDNQLAADGFHYLQDGMWGRGPKTMFIIDVTTQEFFMAENNNLPNIPEDWYATDFYGYAFYRYSHTDRQLYMAQTFDSNGNMVTDGSVKPMKAFFADVLAVGGNYYELPIWMDYYTSQFENYGCSIDNLTVETLTTDYKTKTSTATASDVISVFDRTSDDGVLRYFADAHTDAKIEDNPRYVELNTIEEYMALDLAENNEVAYEIFYLYHDYMGHVFQKDETGINGVIFKEFVKDVIYPATTSILDKPTSQTFGYYFVYIDNSNGEFEYMYSEPAIINERYNYNLLDFYQSHSPFTGYGLLVNKSQIKEGLEFELFPYDIAKNIDSLLMYIKTQPNTLNYSEEFITNYTRPFNYVWQNAMGLTAFFDEKYGFLDGNTVYEDDINDEYPAFQYGAEGFHFVTD